MLDLREKVRCRNQEKSLNQLSADTLADPVLVFLRERFLEQFGEFYHVFAVPTAVERRHDTPDGLDVTKFMRECNVEEIPELLRSIPGHLVLGAQVLPPLYFLSAAIAEV